MRDDLSRMTRLLDRQRTNLAAYVDRARITLRPLLAEWRSRALSLQNHAQRRALWRAARPLLVFAAAYVTAWSYLFVAAFLGAKPPPAPLFPPGAVLLSTLLLAPRRHWWRFLVAAFLIQVPILAYLHLPFLWNLLGFIPDAVEPLIAVSLIRRYLPLPLRFASLREVSIYTACVAFAVLITATLGSTVNAWLGGQSYWTSWEGWYLGDLLACLVLAPTLLLWIAAGARRLRAASRRRATEAALLYGGLLTLGLIVINTRLLGPEMAVGLIYLPVPLLLWAAVRFGPRGVASALSLFVVLAIPAVANARGPFASHSAPAAALLGNLFTLQLFLLVIGVPLFFLAALMRERTATESRLWASDVRYQAVVETQTEMVTRYRPDSTLTFVNDAACRYTGKSREELLGTPFLAALPTTAATRVREAIQTLLVQPDPGVLTIEHETWGLDGTLHWQQWVNRTILDSAGQVIELQGIGRDVTDRKQAEEALRASEARYRMVVRNLPNSAVLLFDAQLRHTFADGLGLAALGLTPAGLEGRTVWEVFPADIAAALATHYEAALAGQFTEVDVAYAQQIFHIQVVPMPAAAIATSATLAEADPARLGMVVLHDVTEQRRAHDELERERTLSALLGALSHEFRTLAEHSPDLIARLDPFGRLLYLNQSGAELLGLRVEQWAGKTFADVGIHGADLEPWEQSLRDVVEMRVPRTVEAEIRLPNGGVRSLHVRYIPELAGDGALRSVLGVATDITALKQAEARVAEQASQLKAIFEAKADGIGVFDRNRRLMRANRAWQDLIARYADITGLSADPTYAALPLAEQVDRLVLRDEHGHVIAREQRPTSRALRGETITGASAVDEWVHNPGGQPAVVFSVSAAPMHDPSGQITGAVTIVRDVTARRQLEARLAEQERLFRTLVEHSPDIIARFDRDLRYLYVSPAIERVSPLPAQAFIGKTNAELGFPESLFGAAHRAITQVFATGQGCTLEEPIYAPDGGLGMDSPDARAFLARIVPEFDADGAVASALAITIDITERKRAELALREAKVAAERARQEEERRRQEAERREAIAASLRDALRILNSKQTLQEVLNLIAEQAGRLLGSAAAAIYGLTEDTPDGLPLLSRVDQSLSDPPSRLPFARAAMRRALASRSPVLVLNGYVPSARSDAIGNGAGAQSRVARHAEETSLLQLFEELPSPYQALLIVPIAVHEEVYGCLMLFYATRWQFASDDVALAIAYADQIALAISNARLQAHIAQAATEAERGRLARELHDTVTQDLYSASLLAEALPRIWVQHPGEVQHTLGQLHEITQSGLATLRLLLLELRSDEPDEMALPALVQLLLNAMRTRAGVPLSLETVGDEDHWSLVPHEVKHAFYRMAQESITNAVKYASAGRIEVRLRRGRRGSLHMEIEDDGVGFDSHTTAPGHFGLTMMRERAQAVGATVRIESQAGHGTRVVIHQKGATSGPAESSAVAVQQRVTREGSGP